MKVLFLTNLPSPYRVDFFNELGKNCELTVLYELESASNRDKKWQAEKSNNFKEIFLKGKKIGQESALCFSVLRYIKDRQYDVIVVGGYSTPTGMLAIEYLNFINRPFILNCDGGMIKNDNKIKYKIKKHFISSANYWLSTGKNTTDYLLNYGAHEKNIFVYPFTSIKKTDIIKSMVSDIEKQDIKNKLNIKEKKVIISVGRFIHSKGFDILIEAMCNLPSEYGVYIIGGTPTQQYENLKDNNKLKNLHFVDFKSKEELKEYYKAADLFVLPTRGDVWGLVINEAMANGLPFITTDKCVSGLEFVCKGKCGEIFRVDEISELVDFVKSTIEDKNKLEVMSKNALSIIEEYTIENMASTCFSILEKVVKELKE